MTFTASVIIKSANYLSLVTEDCRSKGSLLKDIFVFNSSRVSQLVTLHVDSKPISVLCHMGDFGCGDGGWTPVMKIDGNKVYYKCKPRLSKLSSQYSVVSSTPFKPCITCENCLSYLRSGKFHSIETGFGKFIFFYSSSEHISL